MKEITILTPTFNRGGVFGDYMIHWKSRVVKNLSG